MRARALAIGCGLLLVRCVPAPSRVDQGPARIQAPGAPVRVWVDAFAGQGGDGSEHHPFRDLHQALAVRGRPLEVTVRQGLYPGPFAVEGAVTVTGPRTAVLHASEGTVLTAGEGAVIRGLTVQGGSIGARLSSAPQLGTAPRLDGVAFSGQRAMAVDVHSGAATLDGCELEASVSEVLGLVVEEGAAANVRALEVRGPYRRGIEARGQATLTVDRMQARDAVTAVFGSGAALRLRNVSVEGGRGPGVFAAEGSLDISGLRVRGHEYGLQTRMVKGLRAEKLELEGQDRAGLALVQSEGNVDEVRVAGSGDFGGVQLVGSNVRLHHLHVESARAYGILVRQGRVEVVDSEIRDVLGTGTDDGDGLHLRAATVTVKRTKVTHVAGAGLVAAEGSAAHVEQLELEGCQTAGLIADTEAELSGSAVTLHGTGGPAVVVPNPATVKLDAVTLSSGQEPAVFADCGGGARVELSHVHADRPIAGTPCVVVR